MSLKLKVLNTSESKNQYINFYSSTTTYDSFQTRGY